MNEMRGENEGYRVILWGGAGSIVLIAMHCF